MPGPALPEFQGGNTKIWDEKEARCLRGRLSWGSASPLPSLLSGGQGVPQGLLGGTGRLGCTGSTGG